MSYISVFLSLLIVLTSLFCIGLVALSQNIRLSIRVYFSLAIVFLNGWILLLYLSNIASPWLLFFNRAVYVSPLLGLFFLGQFSDVYYKKLAARHLSKLGVASLITVIPGAIIACTSANVIGTKPRLLNGHISGYSIIPGPLSLVVAVCTFILAITLITRLFIAYKTADSNIKKPLRLILRTLTLAIVVALGTNIIFPLIFGGSELGNIVSSIAATIFIVSLAYSVLRYSFLDVKLLVVRSVGYVVGLLLVLLLVGLLQIGIFNVLGFDTQSFGGRQRVVLLCLFVLAIVIFQPLRTIFAQLTKGLFFKGGYDSSKFISQFNANLVKDMNIKQLLEDSVRVVDETFKPTLCAIGILKARVTPMYLSTTSSINDNDKKILADAVKKSSTQLYIKEGGNNAINQDIDKMLANTQVEVLVKLTESVKGKSSTIGFIVLGPKNSGEIYNKTDINAIRIVANELELAIQNALRFEEIQQFNTRLQEEVANATHKLRKTNQKLQELDETKDDFISMASHQLRTPLTSVKGYLSMVLEGDAGQINQLQKQMLQQAFDSSQRMVFLITDLLNISRLKTGKFVIESTKTDLSSVVEQEVRQLLPSAELKHITLSYTKPQLFPILPLDETKTRQVIMNFIDNAIYYTPDGGHITVTLEDRPESVELRVIDNGIGVPRSEQHHLFTKFYRAGNARKMRPDGTGLGLFMAKKVIAAQGGSIIFSSKENEGSTFGFTLSKFALSQLKPADMPNALAILTPAIKQHEKPTVHSR